MNAAAKKRYKNIEFPFTCPISSRIFENPKGLSCYVTKTLKMNHEEYYDKYINHRDSSCFFCLNKGKFISISKGYRNLCENTECVKNSFSSHSIEGFMYRNMCSREESEILFKLENERQLKQRTKTQRELRSSDPLWDKKRSRNCKEFWIERGYNEEEAILNVKEVMDEIHKKTSIKLKSNPEKYASKYPTKIEYYLERGYSEEEAKVKISEIQNKFSLQKCIEKYGKIDGLKLWKDRQIRWMNTMNSKTDSEKLDILKRKSSYCKKNYSWISQQLFWSIYRNLSIKENIYFNDLNAEFIISRDKTFIYDFVDNNSKKVIEFNGDYWHCNPEKYDKDYYHKHLKLYAKERWENDRIRNEKTFEYGYKILTIWESEYRKNPQQILEKCIKFIND
jgi:very-short-patch-repair endonuclease